MGQPARKRATYDELLALPEHVVGEILHGTLQVMPRPALPHARAATSVSEALGPPFNRGRGGPGGWIILFEPELHLGDDVLVPDVAGWRRERVPNVPTTAAVSVAPDWICEVVSPSTEAVDRSIKVPIYARERVPHVWLVDPLVKTLEVLRLDGPTYRLLVTLTGDADVRAEPFDAVPFPLGWLWET